MKAWPVFAIFFIQVILFLGHWLIFSTLVAFWPGLSHAAVADLRIAIFVLAFIFVAASLLSFRFTNFPVHLLYTIAAVWLGFLNLFFWAAFLVRLVVACVAPFASCDESHCNRHLLAGILFGLAALAGVYGLINARVIRIRRIALEIPNLPAAWRGRRAVLISDLHLGPVNGADFCRRLLAMASRFKPDIVFIPGDLFDGTKVDLDSVLAPFKKSRAAFGIYFSTGNHEEFTVATHYLEAVTRAGIHVLANESVDHRWHADRRRLYQDSTHIIRMKALP